MEIKANIKEELTKGRITDFEYELCRGLWERGYTGSKLREFFLVNFRRNISTSQTYKLVDEFRLGPQRETSAMDKRRAGEILKEYDRRLMRKVDEALEKATEMSLDVDNEIMDAVREKKIGPATLVKLSRDLFDRKQILQNKPTAISGKEKLSDNELYERIKKLRERTLELSDAGGVKGDERRGEGVVVGDSKETGRGTDTLLETAQEPN